MRNAQAEAWAMRAALVLLGIAVVLLAGKP
jgi:hypothetical protein